MKLALLLVFLTGVALVPHSWISDWSASNPLPWLAILPPAAMLAAGLPIGALLLRASLVLPFSAVFGILLLVNGDGERAASVIAKSYLSATAAISLAATTRGPDLFRALESFKLPRVFVLLLHFTYRYIFVLAAQAIEMRDAAKARGMRTRVSLTGLASAGGAVAMLFARSYSQAESIHRAMLARGFSGKFTSTVRRTELRAD